MLFKVIGLLTGLWSRQDNLSVGVRLSFVVMLFSLGCYNTLFAETTFLDSTYNTTAEFRYSFGLKRFLPSLVANTPIKYDSQKNYSDIWISWETKLNPKFTYSGSVELTNQPPTLIGTKHTRPDYPISTGRFQDGRIEYQSKSLKVLIGRTNFFDESSPPDVLTNPINGDGVSWTYSAKSWSFKHVIETLPSEKSEELVFRRLLSYHHLKYSIGQFQLGAGEYFLLTGQNISIDFKRINPFVPYSRFSHDSYSDEYEGYNGDSDNAIIKLFTNWSGRMSSLNMSLYVDEFQIDSDDRKYLNDALLFNIYARMERLFYSQVNIPLNFEGMISISTPNFGQHPGPFTTATSGGFPLFEYSPGMTSLFFFKSEISPFENNSISVSYHHENWVEIATLSPELRNLKSKLNDLTRKSDSRVSFSFYHQFEFAPMWFICHGWINSDPVEKYGGQTGLIYRISL